LRFWLRAALLLVIFITAPGSVMALEIRDVAADLWIWRLEHLTGNPARVGNRLSPARASNPAAR